MRDYHPLFHDRFHNRWILSRYWDVDGAFQDNASYDRAMYKPDGPYDFGSRHVFGPNILEYGNSDEHRRLRKEAKQARLEAEAKEAAARAPRGDDAEVGRD